MQLAIDSRKVFLLQGRLTDAQHRVVFVGVDGCRQSQKEDGL